MRTQGSSAYSAPALLRVNASAKFKEINAQPCAGYARAVIPLRKGQAHVSQMDIYLDSNILISDPWMNSARIHALFEYAEKTSSTVILLEPVEMEVREHFKRNVESKTSRMESAIRDARRSELLQVPEFNASACSEATLQEWHKRLENRIKGCKLFRVPLNSSVLHQAIERATQRRPPCKESGHGTRDAVIWLNVMEACRTRLETGKAAFISENTKDFADGSNNLHPELAADCHAYHVKLDYYPSLDVFLERNAKQYEVITLDWLVARFSHQEVEGLLTGYLDYHGDERWFRIVDSDEAEHFRPISVARIDRVDLDVTGPIYIVDEKAGDISVSVGCGAYVDGLLGCERTKFPAGPEWEYASYKELAAYAEIGLDLDLTVKGDCVEIQQIGEVYRI
jgi:predicted nucleic acid-binding protein